ncbi:Asp23/Gls24 family envelope stress response protein [uncultured Veillonella sp.]|uniref:Asp23/Gls24 family envelope stress response protein n=1 Tax=uncultured Veillonella sp. TaxID=159268 RepID=UPI00262C1BCE|nr:Asp23/Gls24 family envelope stress response protein [uncultured Veillonella sp.]
MNQNKSFSMNSELKVQVSDDVILQIATQIIAQVPGYHSLSSSFYHGVVNGIARNFGQKNLPGMNVKHRKEGLEINIYVNVLYGYSLVTMAEEMRQRIKAELKRMLDIQDVRIDVHFEHVIGPDQVAEETKNETES